MTTNIQPGTMLVCRTCGKCAIATEQGGKRQLRTGEISPLSHVGTRCLQLCPWQRWKSLPPEPDTQRFS